MIFDADMHTAQAEEKREVRDELMRTMMALKYGHQLPDTLLY